MKVILILTLLFNKNAAAMFLCICHCSNDHDGLIVQADPLLDELNYFLHGNAL